MFVTRDPAAVVTKDRKVHGAGGEDDDDNDDDDRDDDEDVFSPSLRETHTAWI
jgi:hypothetical protein